MKKARHQGALQHGDDERDRDHHRDGQVKTGCPDGQDGESEERSEHAQVRPGIPLHFVVALRTHVILPRVAGTDPETGLDRLLHHVGC